MQLASLYADRYLTRFFLNKITFTEIYGRHPMGSALAVAVAVLSLMVLLKMLFDG